MKAFHLTILGAALLMGCSRSYDKSQLYGIYVLNAGPGTDRIELKADGTYIHSFQTKDGNATAENEKWQLEEIENRPTVDLNDFQSTRGFHLLPVENWFGKICLMTNEDTNECYEKK